MRADEQVLVCPSCQGQPDWSAELQRCAACGSLRLSRALGITRCSACGHLEDSGDAGRPAVGPGVGDLRDEVDAAIHRVLGDHAGG